MLMRLRPSFAFFGENEWSEKNFIKIKGLENIFSRHFYDRSVSAMREF